MTRSPVRTAITALTLMLVSACGTDPSASTDAGSGSPGGSTPVSAAPSAPVESIGIDVASDFPAACGVATAEELAAIVGNPLSNGGGFTNLICDWESDAEATSVSLLLQPIPAQFCSDGLPVGEATEIGGYPGSIGYDDIADIPGAQAAVCVDAGLVLVTVTGGYGAPSDEARYTGEAVEILELVLGRL